MLNTTIASFKEDTHDLSTEDQINSPSHPLPQRTAPILYHHALLQRDILNDRVRKIRNKYAMGMPELAENDK